MVELTSVVVHERHLDVELGEFGLPVGAEVLIAETAGDLEIAVEARDHQELLVELGRLGQGVAVSGMDPAGDQEIAGTFRGAAAEDRRLDFEEAQVGHDPSHELGEPVADDEDFLHLGPAQVEIAISQPELLVRLGAVHLEWRGGRGVVEHQLPDPDLDRAGLELGVLLAGQPGSDRPLDADDVLVPQLRARAWSSWPASGSKTTWVTPYRSRRSMKTRPPKSRQASTQPFKVTDCPT